MRFLALCALFGIASTSSAQVERKVDLFAQDPAAGDPSAPVETIRERQKNAVPNPFAQPISGGMAGAGMAAESMMDMEDMMGGMGGMGGDMDMADMGMGGGMYGGPSPEQVFREGLQRAIVALRKAKSDEEKETLRGHIREAFENRYETMITERKRDIARLKQSLANLEAEMQRRAAAKDRVVQLQLQSVQLAAEGILEPNELLPSAGIVPGAGGYGGGR